jgi:hypothetical protein
VSLARSKEVLDRCELRASIVPASLDLTDCPYMWPYCAQSLYATAQPIIFNATILNGMGVFGEILEPPRWVPKDMGGELLDVLFTYSEALWPWSGHLSLFISVREHGAQFSGDAHGVVEFTVVSPPVQGEKVRSLLRASCTLLQPDVLPLHVHNHMFPTLDSLGFAHKSATDVFERTGSSNVEGEDAPHSFDRPHATQNGAHSVGPVPLGEVPTCVHPSRQP